VNSVLPYYTNLRLEASASSGRSDPCSWPSFGRSVASCFAPGRFLPGFSFLDPYFGRFVPGLSVPGFFLFLAFGPGASRLLKELEAG
jgi:hypothetical protein